MYNPFAQNSPKIDQAIHRLAEGEFGKAVKMWCEAMEVRGKCAQFCDERHSSTPLHNCTVCFEGYLWHTALYSKESANGSEEQINHLALAQKLRDWLCSIETARA